MLPFKQGYNAWGYRHLCRIFLFCSHTFILISIHRQISLEGKTDLVARDTTYLFSNSVDHLTQGDSYTKFMFSLVHHWLRKFNITWIPLQSSKQQTLVISVRHRKTTTMLTLAFLGAATVTLSWMSLAWIYNLYFHPISQFPGPRAAGATRFWRFLHEVIYKSSVTEILPQLHEKYGKLARHDSSGCKCFKPYWRKWDR